MNTVPGIKGYSESSERFIESSKDLNFDKLCADFIPFLPFLDSFILDLGYGIGQNSFALAKKGYKVWAVDLLNKFIEYANQNFNKSESNGILGRSMPQYPALKYNPR